MPPILTLTTDFGVGSPYVAEMKGVMLSRAPGATIVDITHAAPPQDIRYACDVLASVTPRFPAESIHVAVVDPGVGTSRRIVCVRLAPPSRHAFVLPDNGLLTGILASQHVAEAVEVTEPRYWLSPVSATFHGRDIMAPVAAALAGGVEPEELGPAVDTASLVRLPPDLPTISPSEIRGRVTRADSFGNLITNITRADVREAGLADRKTVVVVAIWPESDRIQSNESERNLEIRRIVATYADAAPGETVALFGSQDRLEIAVSGGSALRELGATPGSVVIVRTAGR